MDLLFGKYVYYLLVLQPLFSSDISLLLCHNILQNARHGYVKLCVQQLDYIFYTNLFRYVRDRMQTGPVFGSKDHFSGLAVIADTYSNHNGPHNVSTLTHKFFNIPKSQGDIDL